VDVSLQWGRIEKMCPNTLLERFEGPPMAKAQKTTPVRLTDEAIKWARIASGYTGESMSEYVSRIVAERGKADADRLHAEMASEKPTPRPRGTKGT
jgi:hypothetical protein